MAEAQGGRDDFKNTLLEKVKPASGALEEKDQDRGKKEKLGRTRSGKRGR